MRIYACSDLHVSPTHFSDLARAFLDEAMLKADLTLLCGDIYEGVWYPLAESVGSQKGQELWTLIAGLPRAVVLAGNHDWTLDEHLTGLRHPVLKSYRFDMDGRSYYATHGWIEYDLAMSLLAPIYTWLFPRLPVLARWWTQWRSPAALKRGTSDALYWRHVREMSNQAMFQAIGEGCVPIWGHSHRRHIDAYSRWLSINCGDFVGGDIGGVVVEDGAPRHWYPT